ncbi:MAM and LDL-receptor class A domain-containing protein 1-like isoform X2 [Gigantopelta aegis]|uniref:MAM and LDL-receptor class A domain-containing protein 1-like isoform X2 n=1 Tax=Gigantopelta aegis TaxID=1735272 RepID=UPI001B88C302|nr:MAM and LDL-receptor class A domain-containing protein 1-like isoform X2 [Gigantopelta aegis]
MKLSFLCLLFLLEVSGQQFKPGCTRPTLVNGRIKIRARGKMIHFRCRKRYTRYGAKYAFCMQGTTWSHPPPLCIARGCPPITNLPNTQIIESFSGALYKFQCAVGLKRSGPEVITCDGKRWSDDPPTCSASLSFKCDFEDSNLCGWSQGSKDDFDWIRTSGVTPTMNTGPQFDHTFMNASLGHYMFIESSSPRNSGDKAKLISPAYPAKLSEMCVEIWYHMLGPDGEDAVGSLEVYVKPVSMDTLDDISPDFYVAGNQGNQWHRGVFKIESQNEDFQLVVVGTRKDAFVSDIAIDDIRLYNCSEDAMVNRKIKIRLKPADNIRLQKEQNGLI